MAKKSVVFVCQQCGEDFPKWLGKCPNCGEWNSLVETPLRQGFAGQARGKKSIRSGGLVEMTNLGEMKLGELKRIPTRISELDRVLGGGLVPGQVVLLAGEPGIGKSTILLQVAENLGNVMYVSGEESPGQIKLRADRLGLGGKKIQILGSTDIDTIVNQFSIPSFQSNLVIIDSIQTMSTGDLNGVAGSVGQVRECAFRLVTWAKASGVPVIMVGHVTKGGAVAGPMTLAHAVDTVLWFEGERDLELRILRSTKNRFGPTDEVGVFRMKEKGLISVSDSDELFLTREEGVSGSVTTASLSGSRVILAEIQALVVKTSSPYPRRVVQGIDPRRAEMLIAVVSRRCNLPLYERDVFLNVVGGLTLRDPGVDLAVCLSLVSAYLDKPFPNNAAAMGEVGLLGEIRPCANEKRRVEQVKRIGFSSVATSKSKNIRTLVGKYFR